MQKRGKETKERTSINAKYRQLDHHKKQQQQQKWKINISQQTKKVAPFSRSHETRCDIVADVSHINQHTHIHRLFMFFFFFLCRTLGPLCSNCGFTTGRPPIFIMCTRSIIFFFSFPSSSC